MSVTYVAFKMQGRSLTCLNHNAKNIIWIAGQTRLDAPKLLTSYARQPSHKLFLQRRLGHPPG